MKIKQSIDMNRGELPLGNKVLLISRVELISIRIPAKNFIIDELIAAGAPVAVSRENRFDVSEYEDSEIEFAGTLIEYPPSPSGDYLRFEWYT